MKKICSWAKSAGLVALSCGLLTLASGSAWSQASGGFNTSSASASVSSFSAQESIASPSGGESSQPAAYGSSQSPFLSSVPEGKATGTVLPLSIKDAIDRALRSNLGLLLSSDSS